MKIKREAWMKWFLREDGQAVVEYGAMLTLMLALLFIMRSVGYEANTLFRWVVSALQ